MGTVARLTAIMTLALAAACDDLGPIGSRPVVEFASPATENDCKDIVMRFTVADGDHSITNVIVEYSPDAAVWRRVQRYGQHGRYWACPTARRRPT